MFYLFNANYLEPSSGLSLVLLLQDGLLDSPSLGEGNLGLVAVSDDENVGEPGGESVALGVTDGDNVEGALVALYSHENSDAPGVVSAGEHDELAGLELDEIDNLAGLEVNLDGVIHLGVRVGEADGASVVGDEGGDLVVGNLKLDYAAELVSGLSGLDPVEDKPSLGVVHEAEGIVGLGHGDNVHEPSGVVVVRADLSVDLDVPLHANLHGLLVGEGVLEPVPKDDAEGKALALLVGSSGRLRGPDALHLAEHPVAGSIEALHVFLRSARHDELIL